MLAPGALCVSLTPRSLDEVFSSDLAGADCVEVRLDYLNNPQEAVLARWDRLPVPVIATCRGRDRGGKFEGSIEDEIKILQYAVENGAKFVDIDYRFARPFAGARVIASFHDFGGTPFNVESILDRACASAGHIAKVATLVTSWADNRRLLALLSKAWPKPVIVAGMGEIGQITRVIGPARGSFLSYASSGEASAPGQLSLREMLNVYRFRRIKRSTKLIGIVGSPVSHSLSPNIHNRAFDVADLDFAYLKFIGIVANTKEFDLREANKSIAYFSLGQDTLPGSGFSVAMRTEGSPSALIPGVKAALASGGFDPADKIVVILGAGGASRAAVAALKEARKVTVLPRREVPDAPKYRCDLLINATPIGMFPMVDSSPVHGPIPAEAVLDMVYNPPITRLLRSARDQGKTVIQGTTMFLAQAARQFEIWTGHRAPAEIFEERAGLL